MGDKRTSHTLSSSAGVSYTEFSINLSESDECEFDICSDEESSLSDEDSYSLSISSETRFLPIADLMIVNSPRRRKWTVYDKSSAEFLPPQAGNEPTPDDLRQMANRCAPFRMIEAVQKQFLKFAIDQRTFVSTINRIEVTNRTNADSLSISVPEREGTAQLDAVKLFFYSISEIVHDDYLPEVLRESAKESVDCNRITLRNLLGKVRRKDAVELSIALRLYSGCGRHVIEPMLDSIREVHTEQVHPHHAARAIRRKSDSFASILPFRKTVSAPKVTVKKDSIVDENQKSKLRNTTEIPTAISPRSSNSSDTKLKKKFSFSKKHKERKEIFLEPKENSHQVQITKCNDGTFMLRHRGIEITSSEMFPCTFDTEWQAEFIIDETATQVLAMFPKIIGLTFDNQKAKEKFESKILSVFKSRLFS